jgi:predicted nucleic acid-binding Zn ribbon protein
MNHEVRTSEARHLNFARDLVRDPFSPAELAQLQAWQKSRRPETPVAGAIIVMPQRTCVVCRGSVPLLRRIDSTTCSERCADFLRRRAKRKALAA